MPPQVSDASDREPWAAPPAPAMTPERWDRVVAAFDGAVSCPPDERDAFLERACAGDPALRAELEALLAADAQASALDQPAVPGAGQVVGAVWAQVERDTWSADDPGPDAGGADRLAVQLQAALGPAYRVERELAGGGMSRVFVADEVALGRRVAVKVLPVAGGDGSTLARFRSEVQLAAALRHPHVVPLLAAGESADGLVYYTMPFIEGESLRQRLEREGPLPVDVVGRVLREVAGALAYAHRRGVVHCDVKPANILVDGEHVLVADFGIARALTEAVRGDASPAALSAPVLGTPAYISPEQAVRGGAVDRRADVYSLGCVVYEMLTGTRPPPRFRPGQSAGPAPRVAPVSAHRAGLTARVDAVVARALASAPDDRWQTATAFADAFADACTPPAVGRRNRTPALVAGLAALALGLAGVGVVAGAHRRAAGASGAAASAPGASGAGALGVGAVSAGALGTGALGTGAAADRTLAVVGFENAGAAADGFLADGLADELRDRVRSIPGVRVAARRDVAFRDSGGGAATPPATPNACARPAAPSGSRTC